MIPKLLAAAGLLAAGLPDASAQYALDWVDRYDGPENNHDWASAVVVAPSGDVYVAGQTYEQAQTSLVPRFVTLKYDAQGNMLWSRLFNNGAQNVSASASGIALDPSGNVVVVGGVNFIQDWGVVKYDPAGNELWNRVIFSQSSFLSSPTDVEVDAAGNIYFVGDTNLQVPNGPNYAVTVKLAPDGTDVWTHAYSGPGGLNGGSSPSALSVDAAGNVYVAGTTKIPGLNGNQFSVYQLNATGIFQWLHTSGTAGTVVLNRAYDLAIDGAGDLVAAGIWGGNTSAGSDLAVVKLDTAGGLVWSRTYDGPAGKSDWGLALAVDAQDAIAVAGYSQMVEFPDQDALVVRYDAAGNQLWDRRYAGGAGQGDWANAIAADAAGRVVVVGKVVPQGAGDSFFTAVYDPAGTLLWDDRYAGPQNGGSEAVDVALDADGSLLVLGDSVGGNGKYDIATIRYAADGPQTYCAAQQSSAGCLPAIGFTGQPSASAGSGFDVTAAMLLNQKNGLLFYGTQGAASLPFLGGTLCVAPPLRRTAIQSSGGTAPPATDCSGALTFDFNAHVATGLDPLLVAGQAVWTQYWSRDPAAVAGANLTDGLTFTLGS